MDAKKKHVDSEEIREGYGQSHANDYREERYDTQEFEVPDEMETWALDDLSDLVPNIFD
jgi:hypothetical protein